MSFRQSCMENFWGGWGEVSHTTFYD
jgi:hypothetical protein